MQRPFLFGMAVAAALASAAQAQNSAPADIGEAGAERCTHLARAWKAMREGRYRPSDSLTKQIDGFIGPSADCRGRPKLTFAKGGPDEQKLNWLRIAAGALEFCSKDANAPACKQGGTAYAALEPLGLAPIDAKKPITSVATALDNVVQSQSQTCPSARTLKQIQTDADSGRTSEMGVVGLYLKEGKCGYEKNSVEARTWLTKAAASGDVVWMTILGMMHLDGDGGPKDETEARHLFEKAAEGGYGNAAALAGGMYFDGVGGPRDVAKARRWLEIGATGSATARKKLAQLNTEEGRHPLESRDLVEQSPAAMRCHTLAANPNDKMRWLGIKGVSLEKMNGAEALAACRAALAEKPDDARLRYQLARALDKTGAHAEKIEQLKKATEGGYSHALVNLGIAYEDGKGAAVDFEQARRFYEKALAAGISVAARNIGYLHEKGRGVKQDFGEARWWFEKAADGGSIRAMTLLGYYYEMGQGGARDYVKAFKLYQRAANAGDEIAMYNLAAAYQSGRGVRRDMREAMNWYEKSAAAGYQKAAKVLAGLRSPSRSARRGSRGYDNSGGYSGSDYRVPMRVHPDRGLEYGYGHMPVQ